MDIETGLLKLNEILPLVKRQNSLNSDYRIIHQDILNSLAYKGRIEKSIDPVILSTLQENDLVVLDDTKKKIVGAYPFSLRQTQHRVFNEQLDIYAMCAFDAVSIAPLFNLNVTIESSCHLSNEKIIIHQQSDNLVKTSPSEDIFIGIRWQDAGTCAADNICMEMVFLKNQNTALHWKASDQSISLFSLPAAIEFSYEYFKPLLDK